MRITFAFILILCFSCGGNPNNEYIKAQAATDTFTLHSTDSIESLEMINWDSLNSINERTAHDTTMKKIIYDIDYVRSQTSSLSDRVNLQYYNHGNGNYIPVDFISKYITPNPITIGYPYTLSPDYPKAYIFREFKAFSDFDLFTFTYDDETCCRTLYAVITHSNTLDVLSIGILGYEGGDGGWSGEKYGIWTSDSTIATTVTSFNDEELEGDNIEIDTIWSVIKINSHGILEEVVIDSVKYIGGNKLY